MDARWLTIHTVCMGLLDSPESSDAKGVIVSGTSTDIICKTLLFVCYNHS